MATELAPAGTTSRSKTPSFMLHMFNFSPLNPKTVHKNYMTRHIIFTSCLEILIASALRLPKKNSLRERKQTYTNQIYKSVGSIIKPLIQY